MVAGTGIDEALRLEAVYLSTPIPRNDAVLTVLGAVFDKVYFPGVHMPTTGYDPKDVKKEIERLIALNDARYETQLLIRAMKLALKAKTLEGFCEFVGDPDDPFLHKDPVPDQLIKALYETINGPPRPGFTPMFNSSSVKGLGGYTGPSLIMPGDYHYIARAMIHSGRTGVPLLNDVPGLELPGTPATAPVNDAKLLAAILAVECTRIALPPVPLLRPEDLMEFRESNAALLRGFRRSMLRYAADLNGKIKGMDADEFERQTKFFIDTQIVPAMDELNVAMNDPARPWHKRAIDTLKIIPEIGGAYLAGGSAAALTKALTSAAAQFFVEVAAKGDKEETLKRSGLTYLLRLKAFHDDRK
ncbi:hypothetical protein [Bradyrhizobium sp. CCBAU 11361]|uniref:hypothetical protein n=1 Tax=Bradyrhizobium sp. CCBAU 11361 TaxID=1630812 RepID=UPI002304F76C|nr:hypothetical protein [Bradyrhizobium sp. CCBAU 11361]